MSWGQARWSSEAGFVSSLSFPSLQASLTDALDHRFGVEQNGFSAKRREKTLTGSMKSQKNKNYTNAIIIIVVHKAAWCSCKSCQNRICFSLLDFFFHLLPTPSIRSLGDPSSTSTTLPRVGHALGTPTSTSTRAGTRGAFPSRLCKGVEQFSKEKTH